jgi:hypothetical protein
LVVAAFTSGAQAPAEAGLRDGLQLHEPAEAPAAAPSSDATAALQWKNADAGAQVLWGTRENIDAVWLQEEAGFRRKRQPESTWTAADDWQFQDRVAQFGGELVMPTLTMETGYFLSHHVMDRKFSARACRRKLAEYYHKGMSVNVKPRRAHEHPPADQHGRAVAGHARDDEARL